MVIEHAHASVDTAAMACELAPVVNQLLPCLRSRGTAAAGRSALAASAAALAHSLAHGVDFGTVEEAIAVTVEAVEERFHLLGGFVATDFVVAVRVELHEIE